MFAGEALGQGRREHVAYQRNVLLNTTLHDNWFESVCSSAIPGQILSAEMSRRVQLDPYAENSLLLDIVVQVDSEYALES